ncbi:MAG: GNAT family N-acetyltransferase [Bacteroidales bacterium]|nr:GNAT family N-acetyltransferase [Bacteroidales bacterium]
MILLDKQMYHMVTDSLKQVSINNLFARSVVEHHVSGSVYADDAENPKTFYVVHPYGMSLLFGDFSNSEFNARFRDYALNIYKSRNKFEWMQAFPKGWDKVLGDLFNGSIVKSTDNIDQHVTNIIELNTRINFKFNFQKYPDFSKKNLISTVKIVQTNKKIFEDMNGSVVPKYFWDNADDFLKRGAGFSLFVEDKIAATAYSAFVHDNKLELGIETVEEFRGRGFAQYSCSALIDYCLEKKLEPVWACRLENIGSFNLAVKLGFEPTAEIPYYRLCK